MNDLPNFDNFQKWARWLKNRPIYKLWLISPIILVSCVYLQSVKLNQLNKEYSELKENITPIRELYPKLELSGAVSKLIQDYEIIKQKLSELHATTENSKRYEYFSHLSASGDQQLGGGLSTPTSISELFGNLEIKITAHQEENNFNRYSYSVHIDCTDDYIKKYNEVIEKVPDFPFTYGALAECAHRKNDLNNFSLNKEKATKILEITSSFAGACIDHVVMLNYLKKIQASEEHDENIEKIGDSHI